MWEEFGDGDFATLAQRVLDDDDGSALGSALADIDITEDAGAATAAEATASPCQSKKKTRRGGKKKKGSAQDAEGDRDEDGSEDAISGASAVGSVEM